MLKIAKAQTTAYKCFASTMLTAYEDGLTTVELHCIAKQIISKHGLGSDKRYCPNSHLTYHSDRRIAVLEFLECLSEDSMGMFRTMEVFEAVSTTYSISVLEDNGQFFYCCMPSPESNNTDRFSLFMSNLEWLHSSSVLRWRELTGSWESDARFAGIRTELYF